jgi:prepilin-type N-terminal cleavage/methylation domain-containing protein
MRRVFRLKNRIINRICSAEPGQARNNKGFALVEILISIAVLSSIGTALISGLSTVYRTDLLNNNKLTAVSIVQSQLEYFDTLTYLPATGQTADYGPFSGTLPSGYTLQCIKGDGSITTTNLVAAPWDTHAGSMAPGDIGIQRIRLAVLQGTKVAFTLDAFKVQVIPQ